MGDKENSFEFNFTLSCEVSVGKRVFVILGDSLVEVVVFIFSDIGLVTEPDGFDLVNGFPFPDLFSNCLGLFLFFLSFFVYCFLAFISNFSIILWLFLLSIFSGGLFLFFNLLSDLLGDEKFDWVLDEFRVFLN